MGKYNVARNKQKAKPAGRRGWLLPILVVPVTLAVIVAGLWWGQSRPNAAFVPEATGRPQASIDQTTFDYGDVKLGTTIQTAFRVKNTGDQVLAILGEPQVEVVEGC